MNEFIGSLLGAVSKQAKSNQIKKSNQNQANRNIRGNSMLESWKGRGKKFQNGDIGGVTKSDV